MLRTVFLTVTALALSAPAAQAITPFQAADAAWPHSPCVGKLVVVWDHSVGARGHAGEATGIDAWTDQPWELRSCTMSIDPAWWATAPKSDRCALVVHEAGHLAGLPHQDSGVMAAHAETPTLCIPSVTRTVSGRTRSTKKRPRSTRGRYRGTAR